MLRTHWSKLALVAVVAATLGLAATLALASPSPRNATRAPATALACSASHWVASWEAAPSDNDDVTDALLDPFVSGPMQTFRVVITPHLGGSTLRIRLSNRFGSAPTTLDDVTIAQQLSGATITSGSSTPVLFSGQRAVTIPAGSDVESDPVEFSFQAFENLAVSIYVSSLNVLPTEHYAGRQTSYATLPEAGDHTTDTAATAYTQKTTARYYLSGLDVEASAAAGSVVAFGDSITDGYQTAGSQMLPEDAATDNLNDRYPDDLQRRLIAAGIPLSVVNAGISGNKILGPSSSPLFGPDGLSRFQADAVEEPGVTTIIILEGINDISSGASAASVISGLTRLVSMGHAAGLRVLLGTLTPDGQYATEGSAGAAHEAVREAVNTWIRGQTVADGVIDFDAAVRDPADPTEQLPAYNDGDGLHFTPAGYQAMANAVPLTDLELPTCAAGQPQHLRVTLTPQTIRPEHRTTVRITVTAARTSQPLSDALVQLDRRHVRTNARGMAALTLTFRHRGRYRVRVSALGYLTRTLSLRVTPLRE